MLIESPYLGWLLSGLVCTLLIAAAALVVALAMGCTVGVLRTLPSPWAKAIGTGYVELFRNVPLLVQLFLWYFVLPEVLPQPAGDWIKQQLPLPEFCTAVLAIGLYTSARIAELVRAGVTAVATGLWMAAASTGLSLAQTYRYILLPITARSLLPPLTSEFLSIVKNSSLALTIGVLELTGQSRQIEANTFQGIEAMTAGTSLYVLVTLVVIVCMRAVEQRTVLSSSQGSV